MPDQYNEYRKEYNRKHRQRLEALRDDRRGQCFYCDSDKWLVKKDPPTCRTCHRQLPDFKPELWTEDRVALLGTTFDRQLAKQFGCSYTAVRNKRVQLGIAAYNQKNS